MIPDFMDNKEDFRNQQIILTGNRRITIKDTWLHGQWRGFMKWTENPEIGWMETVEEFWQHEQWSEFQRSAVNPEREEIGYHRRYLTTWMTKRCWEIIRLSGVETNLNQSKIPDFMDIEEHFRNRQIILTGNRRITIKDNWLNGKERGFQKSTDHLGRKQTENYKRYLTTWTIKRIS